jgi:hypothetical protein
VRLMIELSLDDVDVVDVGGEPCPAELALRVLL